MTVTTSHLNAHQTVNATVNTRSVLLYVCIGIWPCIHARFIVFVRHDSISWLFFHVPNACQNKSRLSAFSASFFSSSYTNDTFVCVTNNYNCIRFLGWFQCRFVEYCGELVVCFELTHLLNAISNGIYSTIRALCFLSFFFSLSFSLHNIPTKKIK